MSACLFVCLFIFIYSRIANRWNRLLFFWLLNVGLPPSQLKRIAAGMLVAILCVSSALLVEIERRRDGVWNATEVVISNTTTFISSVSIFYQIPQYFLSGLAESLVMISGKW